MTARRTPHDSPTKAEEENQLGDDRSPMDDFRGLARGIINVSREALKREEQRYAVANAARKAGQKTDGRT